MIAQIVRPTAGAIMRSWLHQLLELLRTQRLRAVAQRVVGIGVHFHQQPVGARGHRGARHGRHLVAAPGAVRRVGHDRQVRQLLHHRDGGDVHGVARVGFEGADAALAQDHFVIAAGQNVFRRKQQLFDGRRDAALQQHRLALLAQFAQQIEVLHVARAHLQDVGVLRHQRNLRLVHHLADHQQAVAVGGLAQQSADLLRPVPESCTANCAA